MFNVVLCNACKAITIRLLMAWINFSRKRLFQFGELNTSASKLENSWHCAKLYLIKFIIRRATSGTIDATLDFPEHGLVRDGTPCGENLVCVNQTCVSLFPYIDTSKCPIGPNNVECTSNGVNILEFHLTFISQSPCNRLAPTWINVTATLDGWAPIVQASRPWRAQCQPLSS